MTHTLPSDRAGHTDVLFPPAYGSTPGCRLFPTDGSILRSLPGLAHQELSSHVTVLPTDPSKSQSVQRVAHPGSAAHVDQRRQSGKSDDSHPDLLRHINLSVQEMSGVINLASYVDVHYSNSAVPRYESPQLSSDTASFVSSIEHSSGSTSPALSSPALPSSPVYQESVQESVQEYPYSPEYYSATPLSQGSGVLYPGKICLSTSAAPRPLSSLISLDDDVSLGLRKDSDEDSIIRWLHHPNAPPPTKQNDASQRISSARPVQRRQRAFGQTAISAALIAQAQHQHPPKEF